MNITRLNFAQTLPFIKNIIKQSHYVSIDLEMSGIVSDVESNPSLVDSVWHLFIYSRFNSDMQKQKREYKSSFHCRQVYAVTGQIHIKTSNFFYHHSHRVLFYPFNFYIYPLSVHQADSVKFSFHSSSLNFLAKNSFDFNKLFYQYVPYISKEELQDINARKQQSELMKQLMRLDTLNSPTTKAFMNMHLSTVEKWIQQNSEGELKINIQYIKFKSYKTLIDQIHRKYPSISFQFTFDSPQVFTRNWLTIKRKTASEEPFSFDQEANRDQLALMNQVMDSIVENRLPIIVHNGVLDLMHIFLRFYQKLPPTWQNFCQKLHTVFPYIYDTKFICSNYPVIFQTLERQTNLQNCYLKLKEDYEKKTETEKKDFYHLEIDPDFREYTMEDTSSHEAGFDALMTGYVFFRAMDKLKKPLENLEKKEFHKTPSLMRNRIPLGNIKVPFNLEQKGDFYTEHANKLFIGRSLLNTIHTEQEITEYFKKHEGAINFYWKDEAKTSFFLTFIDKSDEQNFIKKHLDNDGLGIVPFLNDKYLFTPVKRESNQPESVHNQSLANQE